MSQYPVDSNDQLFQAVNYLLSGPSGLGQNFAGFSSSSPAWLTGNFRLPFTVASTTKRATGYSGAFEITVKPDLKGIRIGYIASGFNIAPGAVVTNISYDVANGYVVTLDLANTDDVDNDVLFTPPQPAELLVTPIPLSTSELLDPYTWKFTFATPQATPPFVNGMGITVANVKTASTSPNGSYPTSFSLSGTKAVLGTETTYSNIFPTTLTGSGSGYEVSITLTATGAVAYSDSNTDITRESRGSNYGVGDTLLIPGTSLGGTSPANDLTLTIDSTTSIYDGDYTPIGVAECTTTYVITRTTNPYSADAPGTGGTVEYYNTVGNNRPPFFMSTDCNGRVTVTGGTDRVFVSAQLDNYISYTTTGTEDLRYTLAVNRYSGFPNTDRVNPDFLFIFDGTVAERVYTFTGLTGTGTLDLVGTVFTSIVDTPGPGYYWYILEVGFQTDPSSDLQVTESEFDLRGLSAQVVKE